MCDAFSCIVGSDKKVTWKLGIDSHTELLKRTTHKDNTSDPKEMTFARVEITPNNMNYLAPDHWTLKIDESITPAWWNERYASLAWNAHKSWLAEVDKILIRKPIIHPFNVTPPTISQEHIKLLREWVSIKDSIWVSIKDSIGVSIGDSIWASIKDSIGDSIGASIGASIWASRAPIWALILESIGAPIGDSIWASIRAPIRASILDSIGVSIWAYIGSFFNIPKWKGKYTFAPAVKLWESGLVPSFDGTTWRLHGGPKGKVLFSIRKEEL